MPNRTVLENLSDLSGACSRFIPLDDFPKTREIHDPSAKEYFVLSKGIPLSEASAESFQEQPTDIINRAVKEARFFSLIQLSTERGIIQCDRSIEIEGVLMLLQADGEGVIGYSADYSFSFYLDYDKTGCVIEMECQKNLLN